MTGLKLYRSNHLEVLGRFLTENVQIRSSRDPFAPLSIVVGSRGMERWLRHAVAERSGICANLVCPFPAAAIDGLIAAVLGDQEDKPTPALDPWGPSLTWALLAVLPELVQRPEFGPLAGYADWSGQISARSFGLARQIADIFDRYITYRPELALAWSAGQSARSPLPSSLAWQPPLWAAVRDQLGQVPHRGEQLRAAELRLQGGCPPALREALAGEPLRIFGVSALPPGWLGLLAAVSRHVEVELYLLCPSMHWWEQVGRRATSRPWRGEGEGGWQAMIRDDVAEELAQDDEGHPLLVSLGRVARDFQISLQAQMAELAPQEDGVFIDRAEAVEPGDGGAALHRLQADVLHARALAGGVGPMPLSPSDDSIQLHACHGLARQVEVLRDVLLGLFADHRDLEPRDVVVMCPDIAAAAPLITAVFERGSASRRQRDGKGRTDAEMWGPAGAPRIPYTIADLSVRRLNPVADALLRVFELVDGRVEASAVLDLLALEPVQRRFGLDDSQVATVQGWIQDSGIRWGVDGAHRAPTLGLADEQNTWRFGLRRLLAGVVMADDGALLDGTAGPVLPFDAMEGGETALLGKLVDFCNTLFDLIERLREARPLNEWVTAAREVVHTMTATSKAASWLTRRVRAELDGLAQEATASGLQADVQLDAVRSALSGRFEVASRLSKDLSGTVTFCAMAPMRSLPHRVVCLLGLDEGTLPRQGGGLAFDLCARRPRVGDRDPRDEDRYLLLEALLSARDHLIVTWTGRDLRSNEPCAPCVPVVEFCHVLDQTFAAPDESTAASRWLLTEHPLQAFSPRNFVARHRDPTSPERPRPWSFDRRLRAAAAASQAERQAVEGLATEATPMADELETLTLDELIKWFVNPSRQFLLTRLKVDLSDHEKAVSDREPIVLDGLQRWSLRDELLRTRLAGHSTERLQTRLRALGQLPLGQAGALLMAEQLAVTDAMLAKAQLLQPKGTALRPDPPVAIDLQVDGIRLTGTLEGVWRGMLVHLDFGAEDGKRLLRPWLRLLAWQAMDATVKRQALIGLGDDKKGQPAPGLLGLDAVDDAPALLAELVALYRRGQREPLPLFLGASREFAKKARAGGKAPGAPFTLADLSAGLPADPDQCRRVSAALDDAIKAFDSDSDRGRDDLDEPAVARLYDGRLPMIDLEVTPVPISLEFARLALTVWQPLLEHRRTTTVAAKWLAALEVSS